MVVRYERHAENFLGMLHLSCSLTLLRHYEMACSFANGHPTFNTVRPAFDFPASSTCSFRMSASSCAASLSTRANSSATSQKPAIVSVVTRGLSDDSTHLPISGDTVYMKIAKSGQAIFVYYSKDGRKRRLSARWNLGPADQQLEFGFSAQNRRLGAD